MTAQVLKLHVKPTKTMISIRVDTDVLEWFKKHSVGGYQSAMNRVLRAYMEEQKRKAK